MLLFGGGTAWPQSVGPCSFVRFGSGLGLSSQLFCVSGNSVESHLRLLTCPSKKMKFPTLPAGWAKTPGQADHIQSGCTSAAVACASAIRIVSEGRDTSPHRRG